MKKKIFINIKQLALAQSNGVKKGANMASLDAIENAWLSCTDATVHDVGKMNNLLPEMMASAEVIDLKNKYVLPAWCDSHTHIVYAGSREREFVDRIYGLTYEEIAARGGGILNSAKVLNATSEDELYAHASTRLHNMILNGTGAIEIKSGYGLTVEGELKMLRVIKRLKDNFPITIKANFLGAHAVPAQYKENRKAYIDLIVNEMLPVIASDNLADFVDVFCDRGFYSIEEANQILEAGKKYGLKPKIHANQLANIGAVQVAVAHGALSVDHCEHIGKEEIDCLMKSETMPTLLPSAAFFLGLPYQPARKMIDSGLPIALATDYNPGSSPSGSMQFILSLACIKLKMLPEEAIVAATINSAAAMDCSLSHGTLTKGKIANFIVTKELPSLHYMPYAFTENCIHQVYINGALYQ